MDGRKFPRGEQFNRLALVMNIPLLYYLLKTETITWLRWLIKAMLLFSFPAVVCTYSRGAWLGLAMVTGHGFSKNTA